MQRNPIDVYVWGLVFAFVAVFEPGDFTLFSASIVNKESAEVFKLGYNLFGETSHHDMSVDFRYRRWNTFYYTFASSNTANDYCVQECVPLRESVSISYTVLQCSLLVSWLKHLRRAYQLNTGVPIVNNIRSRNGLDSISFSDLTEMPNANLLLQSLNNDSNVVLLFAKYTFIITRDWIRFRVVNGLPELWLKCATIDDLRLIVTEAGQRSQSRLSKSCYCEGLVTGVSGVKYLSELTIDNMIAGVPGLEVAEIVEDARTQDNMLKFAVTVIRTVKLDDMKKSLRLEQSAANPSNTSFVIVNYEVLDSYMIINDVYNPA